MAKIQWVNLPSEDDDFKNKVVKSDEQIKEVKEMGRIVHLEAEFDKKDIVGMATLLVEPDGDNATYYPRAELALDADLYKQAEVSNDGKAKFKVELSAAGGDKFKFKATDLCGTTKDLSDEYETRRRIYYQVIPMVDINGLSDYSFLESEFKKNKREIHLKKIDAKGTIQHSYNFSKNRSEYARLFEAAKKAYNDEFDLSAAGGDKSYCFAMVWVDCLADGPHKVDLPEKRGVSKASGTATLTIDPPWQLWKDIDKSPNAIEWNSSLAFVYMKDGKEQTYSITDEDLKGTTYSQVIVNTRHFPEGVTGKIKGSVYVAKGFQGGWSFPTCNIIVIATRGRKDQPYDKNKQQKIVVHESGHKIDMVPNGKDKGLPLIKQSTLDETHDTNKKRKVHCIDKTGCVMWWQTDSGSNSFCSVCDKSVRKMNLNAPTLKGFTRFF